MAVDKGSMAGGERRKSINGCGGDDRDYDDAYMLVHDDDGDSDGSANDDDFVYFSKSILLCIVVLCARTCVLVAPYSPAHSLSFSVTTESTVAAFRFGSLRVETTSSSSSSSSSCDPRPRFLPMFPSRLW